MLLIVVVDFFIPKKHELWHWGILPRTKQGLLGILFAPWLHANIGHWLANAPPFFCMGYFLLLRSEKQFFYVCAFGVVVGGLGVWCIGRESYHVGLSGLIFSFFGYLMVTPCYEDPVRIVSLLVTVVVGFFYAGLLMPKFSSDKDSASTSWEGHMCGAAAGVAWCFMYHRFLAPHSTYRSIDDEPNI